MQKCLHSVASRIGLLVSLAACIFIFPAFVHSDFFPTFTVMPHALSLSTHIGASDSVAFTVFPGEGDFSDDVPYSIYPQTGDNYCTEFALNELGQEICATYDYEGWAQDGLLCRYLNFSSVGEESWMLRVPGNESNSVVVTLTVPCDDSTCSETDSYGPAPFPRTLFGREISCDVFAGYIPQISLFGPLRVLANTNADTAHITATVRAAPACKENCFSNVAFLPGLEASRLYIKEGEGEDERQLWEPTGVFFSVQDLLLDEYGESIRGGIYTRDVIGEGGFWPYTPLIYQPFLDSLARLKTEGTINDFVALPYDWRKGVAQIVEEPVAYADSYRALISDIKKLAASSKTGKVTIVAHSLGGLVAKEMMSMLEREGKANIVDRIIFVAVPHLGTPKAIAGLLHGAGQELPDDHGFVVSQQEARMLAEQMKSAYALLPSPRYYSVVEGRAKESLNFLHAAFLGNEGGVPDLMANTYPELFNFLTSGRADPEASDTERPNLLSVNFVREAEALHERLDTWTPPSGVYAINLVGWGSETVAGLSYATKRGGYVPSIIVVQEGDETVIGTSAHDGGWDTAYFNMGMFNKEKEKNIHHSDILTALPIITFITNKIQNIGMSLNYITNTPPTPEARVYIRMASPVDILATDKEGRRSGIIEENGVKRVINEIPTAVYHQIGEEKFLALPKGEAFDLGLIGTDEGTFTLSLSEKEDEVETPKLTYSDVPVNKALRGTLSVVSHVESNLLLSLDTNGDGIVDQTILPLEVNTPTFPELLVALRAEIVALPTSPTTKINLTSRTNSLETTYQKRLALLERRAGKRSELAEKLDARSEAGFASFESYTQKLAVLPPSKKQKLTAEQETALDALIENIETTLVPDEESGLYPEDTLVKNRFTSAREEVQTLALVASVQNTIIKKITAAETRYFKKLSHLGTFDERTKLAEAKLKAALQKKLDAFVVYLNSLVALPTKNKNKITEAQATTLKEIINKIKKVIE